MLRLSSILVHLTIFNFITLNGITQNILKPANISEIACQTWLRTNAVGASVKIGDLDISGNQITVEAVFNRTTPYSGGPLYAGDLVSKHDGPNDVNYLLRPNSAEITTTTGYHFVTAPCEIQLNKNYHVALVYNGSTLKFYRDGVLLSQSNVQGNLYQNNWITTIGDYAFPFPDIGTNFTGYINEVRIWNVARTADELRSFMFSSLPNPQSQVGLQAYFRFNSLINLQGNTTYNGVLTGSASINQSNDICEIIADSCSRVLTPYIINNYTPVISLDRCENKITVEDATAFNPGDTVLMIQMKGAIVDSTNTANFGTVTNLHNAGNYEFNYIQSINGNTIILKNELLRNYDLPNGAVQLVRVPYYTSVNINAPLSCPPWDGKVGGVLVLNARDTIKLNADIDVSGKGFRGGFDPVTNPASFNCNENNFYYPDNADLASGKGESYTSISISKSFGKGKLASGGGGGNSHNSGGGGGSNANTGGWGGYQFEGAPCNSTVPFDNRGYGGVLYNYSNADRRIFLGGGGGAGQSNNTEGFQAKGGNGGGIAFVMCDKLINNGYQILANGSGAVECGASNSGCHEGSGGGGGGGSILIKSNAVPLNVNLKVQGGKGGDLWVGGLGKLGPGGGGSGGIIWYSSASVPATITPFVNGGSNGVCQGYGNDAWGATSGGSGVQLTNLALPFSTIPFVKNLDSVAITNVNGQCQTFQFNATGYTQHSPITTWQWNFGDLSTGTNASETHTYTTNGTYDVTLIGEDALGCKDTATVRINTSSLTLAASPDTTLCSSGETVSVTIHANTTASNIIWSPAGNLNNVNLLSPTATINSTTTFYVQASAGAGCSAIDSITVYVETKPSVQTITDTIICAGDPLILTSSSNGDNNQWNNGTVLSNSNSLSPAFTGTSSSQLILTATNTTGCFSKDTVNVTVNPIPILNTTPDTSFCGSAQLQLNATGANSYAWSPIQYVSNPSISNPVFSATIPGLITMYVIATSANGCKTKDSVQININAIPTVNTIGNTSVCAGNPLTLSSTSNAGSVHWFPPNAVSNANTLSPQFISQSSQSMMLVGLNVSTGCADTANVIITVEQLPDVQTINDFSTCSANPVTLTTNGANTYQWSPSANLSATNISSPVFTPPGNGIFTFFVTGFSANGCSNKDSVKIITGATPVFQAPVQPASKCAGESVQLNANNGAAYQYTWSPPLALNNINSENPVATPATSTTYSVLIHDAVCNYDSTFQVMVNINPRPNIQATSSNDLDCSNYESQLSASGAGTFTWLPVTGLSDPNSPSPVATPSSTTAYIVTGTSVAGCTGKDTVVVQVKGGQYFSFNIPNSFTPNGDNLNDCFGVKYWGITSRFRLMVYNRWGEKVFETSDPKECWDGTYKFKHADAGNYVFHLIADTPCGNVLKKGNLLLIR